MRLIDVSVLKEWVENWFVMNRFYHPYAKNNNIPITELYDILEQMPTIEERKTGRWIHDGFDHPHGVDWCHCSICGNRESVNSVYTQVDIYPYCAKCGAKMEDENETNR